MKTNVFLKQIGAACLMAALTSGAMAQTTGSSGSTSGNAGTQRPANVIHPTVPPRYNQRPVSTPQEGLPPVMGTPANGNGRLNTPGYVPPASVSPLSPGFVSNSMSRGNDRRMFAATNPPPNVTSFPFTNATGPFPSNPATGVNPPR